MLRGNHECRQMTSFFNFRDECEVKHDLTVYNAFMEAFDALPLACLINGKFLALHGGLSPDLTNLKQIDRLDRFSEPPREGILCDLLWSDPVDENSEQAQSKEVYIRNEVGGFFTGGPFSPEPDTHSDVQWSSLCVSCEGEGRRRGRKHV